MRLFAAVRFPPDFLRALTDCQRSVRKAAALSDPLLRANWSREENLHLTLAFIGERREAESAVRALRTVKFEPFRIQPGGWRKFGDVLVLGIRDGGECANLALSVRAALDEAGIPYDPKPPSPHVTLARKFTCDLPEGAGTLVPKVRADVASFSLMESSRKNGVLTYTELWRSGR